MSFYSTILMEYTNETNAQCKRIFKERENCGRNNIKTKTRTNGTCTCAYVMSLQGKVFIYMYVNKLNYITRYLLYVRTLVS